MDDGKVAREQVDALELAPGTPRAGLEGWVPALAGDEDLRDALEKAFDYRGDVTITLKGGERFEAYIFDRRSGPTLGQSVVRYYTPSAPEKRSLTYDQIARLEFTGKDRAAGKQWEDWVTKYAQRKAAGETHIALAPESLD